MKQFTGGLLSALAVSALAISFSAEAQAQTLSIATLPQGSTFNTMGSVIANTVRRHADIQMVVQPYGGTAAVMQALDEGLAEFTLLDVNDAIMASTGTGHSEGQVNENLRIVAVLRPMELGFFVAADSDIHTVSDLAGKRVTSGWTAFPMGAYHTAGALAAAGLSIEDTVGVPVPDLIGGADAVGAGRADATMFAIGAPKVAELDASLGGVRFLPISEDASATPSDETLQRVQDVSPAFYLSLVEPAPPYVGVAEPMQMLTWDLVLVASPTVPEETVDRLLGALFENRDEMVEAFPLFGPLSAANAYKNFPEVEYHAGAVAYYEAAGIEMNAD
ncbi:MAG: TAXI family TRAP transporter solute-binding subunit [Mesorhizobium sp.]|nr:TAXI family TRAP transporter solute-binding subunit [Mesorhizobium sp.]